MDGFGDEAQNISQLKGRMPEFYALPPDLRIRRLSLFGHWPVLYGQKERPEKRLCLQSATVLRCYSMPTKPTTGRWSRVGEYLQASQQEWDIFIEEDFRARIENIREWLGDGVIADYDDPEIERLLADVEVPIVGVGGSYHRPECYPRCTILRRITPRWSKAPSCI